MTATLKACGTYPVTKERLIWFSIAALTKGKTSLSSLVGIGSSRHVADLEEVITEVRSDRSIGEKLFKYAPSLGAASVGGCDLWSTPADPCSDIYNLFSKES